jgi:hypothetical protein
MKSPFLSLDSLLSKANIRILHTKKLYAGSYSQIYVCLLACIYELACMHVMMNGPGSGCIGIAW